MESFYRFDFYALLILLGVFQGFFISVFLIGKEFRQKRELRFLALLIITVSLTCLEILLSYTGVLTKVIYLNDFSEPLNFATGPLLFLFVYYGLFPDKKILHWPHFVWFGFYLVYQCFYFIQPNELKYNSYVSCYHPGAELLKYVQIFSDDPIGLKDVVNQLTFFHYLGYSFAAFYYLLQAYKNQKVQFWTVKSCRLNNYRSILIHFWVIIFGFLFVKIYFGRDLGDYYLATYVTFLLYITSFLLIRRQGYFQKEVKKETPRYWKSGLDEAGKNDILSRLEKVMDSEQYYKSNLASLSDISAKIHETPHNVSQVINEKIGMNFFHWLAGYRVNEAQKILSGKDASKYKIEEIADMVGYNSKASFNKVFKEFTGQTPSQYRSEMIDG